MFFPTHVPCSTRFIFLDFITLMISGGEYKLCTLSSSCSLIQSPVTFFLMCNRIYFSTPFSNKFSSMKKPTNVLMNYIRCLLTTPTCFGRLLRPSSGWTLLKSIIKRCVWRISPRSGIIKCYEILDVIIIK
jgi:hypothetical protein